jgi:Ras-related protein Rab-32
VRGGGRRGSGDVAARRGADWCCLFPFPSPPAGQDRFGALYRIYYRDAFGVMLVFDLSRPETFHSVLKWKREIDNKVTLPNGKPLPVILLANKADLPDHVVDKAELDAFCKEHGFICWMETSAKTNLNIEESVKGLVTNILSHTDAFEAHRLKKAAETAQSAGGATISLAVDGAEKKAAAGGGCC